MRKKHRNLLILFFVLYGATFFPNFGIFNSLIWIGPLPQPLAWVLFLNIINTVIIFIVYKKFFKPFAKRSEEN
jgi:hypothetical protein